MITEAFEQSAAPVRLHAVGDGDQAMQFLRRAEGFAEAPGPACRPGPADYRWFPELIELPRPS